MTIRFFLMTRDLKKDQFIGFIESSYFDKIKSLKNPVIKILGCVDPCDQTYFNKKQLNQIKKEIQVLQHYDDFAYKQFAILNYAVQTAIFQDDFAFLVLVGD